MGSPDIYWDEIVSIEDIGEQQVYDLTVPDGENFIAQDVIVHNTAMALSLAHNTSLKHGHTVALFSLEMSKEQLVARILSMDAMVDQQRLRTGYIDDDEWERISYSVGRLSEANIYIDDTPGITLAQMRSKARRLMMEHGFDLLIVDYLQLMQGSGGGFGHENRVQQISEISRGLKILARELNVPILALSQLSRAVESRSDKKPQLSDLRESGSIEQDADIVMFIYRDEIYNPDTPTVPTSPILSLPSTAMARWDRSACISRPPRLAIEIWSFARPTTSNLKHSKGDHQCQPSPGFLPARILTFHCRSSSSRRCFRR